MRPQRIQEIENYIIKKKAVTLDDICEHFCISKSTLRRDLDEIIAGGKVRKIYGGVEAVPSGRLISFVDRSITKLDAKRLIAHKAAEFVKDGDIIFIDSGTTTLHMADKISARKNLTVLTNNLEIIIKLIPYENIQVISLSGILNRKTLSFTGSGADTVLKQYNVSKVFMACTGISVENGITNSSSTESNIKREAVGKGQQVFLLADSRKFGVVSLITYSSTASIDTLICDEQPPAGLTSALKKSKTKILIANM